MRGIKDYLKEMSQETWWHIKHIWSDKDIRYWTIIFLLLLAMAVAIFYHFYSPRHTKMGPANLDLKPTVIYKDIHGNKRSNITGIIVSEDEFKRVTDSFKTLLSDKRVEIKEVTKYVNIIDTVLKKIYVKIDTSGNFEYEHNDDYISLRAWGNYRSNEGNFRLRGVDTITHISYVKKRLFRSNEVKVNLSNSSPYYSITEGASLTLREPKSILVFGPQVGITYTGDKLKPYVGLGMTYNLFSIKTRR